MASTTITTNYDGDVWWDGADYLKTDTGHILQVGLNGKARFRTFLRFANVDLPAGTITQVQLKVYVSMAGGESHLTDIHAYNSVGQDDPSDDGAEDCYNRCASGNLYVDDDINLRALGSKTITLGGNVCTDLANARDAGTPFALSLHEEGDDDPVAGLDSLETVDGNPAQLIITYEIPPPVVWGGSALPQLQMAKAILGL